MGTWIQLTYGQWWLMGVSYGRYETRIIMTNEAAQHSVSFSIANQSLVFSSYSRFQFSHISLCSA